MTLEELREIVDEFAKQGMPTVRVTTKKMQSLLAVAKAAKALTRPGDKLPKGTKAQSDYYMNAMKALDAALAEMESK